jgi:hypothetical protein
MSSLYPDDEQPETRDELDDVLDNLLTGARRDLHTSVDQVLDQDRGLDAIVGRSSTQAADCPTAPAESGPSRSTRNTHPRTPLWIKVAGDSAASSARDGQDSVVDRLENLRKLLKRNPKLRSALPYLHALQVGLAERRLSRRAAVELIRRTELVLKEEAWSVAGQGDIRFASTGRFRITATIVSLITLAAFCVGSLYPTVIGTVAAQGIGLGLAGGAAVVGYAIQRWRRAITNRRLRRRQSEQEALSNALTLLRHLRSAIARLFDDSHDGSIRTSPR